MTSITVQEGKLVLRDGAIGTEQACCCKKCEGPCDEENPCPEGCICCNGECVEEIPEGECCGPCDEENPCPEGCECVDGECVGVGGSSCCLPCVYGANVAWLTTYLAPQNDYPLYVVPQIEGWSLSPLFTTDPGSLGAEYTKAYDNCLSEEEEQLLRDEFREKVNEAALNSGMPQFLIDLGFPFITTFVQEPSCQDVLSSAECEEQGGEYRPNVSCDISCDSENEFP